MRFTVFTCSAALLSAITISGCSGSGMGASPYTYNGSAPGYAQQGYAQQGYAQNGYGCDTGYQSTSYGSGYSYPSTGCMATGSGYSSYLPSQTNAYAQGTYAVSDLRGAQPANYGHDMYAQQGTVLRGSAPYGAAVGNGLYNYGEEPVKQTNAYMNAGVVGYDVGDSLYGVQARLGYNFNPVLGAEVEASIGVANVHTGVGTSEGIDHSVGAFVVARAPLGPLSLLARGGYHATTLGFNVPAGSVGLGTDGFAYGVGAELALDRKNAIRLDYTRYNFRQTDYTSNAGSVSYVRKF